MSLPSLTPDDVENLLPGCKVVGASKRGGQKLFYPIEIGDESFGAKFVLTNPPELQNLDEQQREGVKQTIITRVMREIDAMKNCKSPYLVGLGPVAAECKEYNGQSLVVFTEELIGGLDLKEILDNSGPGTIRDVVQFGLNIGEAIKILKEAKKLHRDIKPANIMRRNTTNQFVLLDMGVVFNFEDVSLTNHGEFVLGTKAYFSPEHTNFEKRRDMDYRSDQFCLGVVMYEYVTGVHPFITNRSMLVDELIHNILENIPDSPNILNSEIPKKLSDVIMRLLEKQPHSRYRRFEDLFSDLNSVDL